MAFKFTEEQLNTLDKSFIVELFLQLQEQNDKLSGEIQDLNRKMELLIEQITLSNKNRFGRSSERMCRDLFLLERVSCPRMRSSIFLFRSWISPESLSVLSEAGEITLQ